ncbi:MAG: ABC transporter permease [Proteobacteria bacterium]|nr:ABC transporter permease [Pseudomonadota bacterium]
MSLGPGFGWHRYPALIAGAAVTLVLVTLAAVSLAWTPYPVTELVIARRLQGPSAAHWLGTDQFGRDVLSMLMAGSRNSIAVGFVAVGIGLTLGVALGMLAAARRGLIDEAVMRLGDFTFAFPAVLSAIMITAIAGPGAINAIIAIGIFNIPVFARLARGAALQVWSRDFILAARAAGKSTFRITLEHVLPNVAGLLVVQATIQFALAILAEASLAYLGLGTQPPNPSWGKMLNEAQTFMSRAPLLAVFPGLAIAVAVLGINLLGDGLRDLIDPKLRRARA